MAFKWTAFPCFAASISFGIGRSVPTGAGSVKPNGASRMALDAKAPQPIANLRRVNVMKLVPVPHRISSCLLRRQASYASEFMRVIHCNGKTFLRSTATVFCRAIGKTLHVAAA